MKEVLYITNIEVPYKVQLWCSCLVSNIPENTEVIGDCGYEFQEGHIKSLQE